MINRACAYVLATLGLLGSPGCAVVTVVDAGVSIAATTVSTAVSVAGTAVSATAKLGGAVIDAVLPDSDTGKAGKRD